MTHDTSIDASVLDGRCYFCGEDVPDVETDPAAPVPAQPGVELVLVRFCADCGDAWRQVKAELLSPSSARRSDG